MSDPKKGHHWGPSLYRFINMSTFLIMGVTFMFDIEYQMLNEHFVLLLLTISASCLTFWAFGLIFLGLCKSFWDLCIVGALYSLLRCPHPNLSRCGRPPPPGPLASGPPPGPSTGIGQGPIRSYSLATSPKRKDSKTLQGRPQDIAQYLFNTNRIY